MNYGETLRYKKLIIQNLDRYCLKNDCVNDSYYVAKKLIIDLTEKSYKNDFIRSKFTKWLKSGGTILLKNILIDFTEFNQKDLTHENAFQLLDTVKK